MIGKIIIGKSFRGCLNYCLDKKLAEVLDYNLCGGNKRELLEQFTDVRNLNQNVSRPVQHVTLSMAKGEQLSKHNLIQLAEECSKDSGFDKNQFVVIQHHDTEHQHIHIVINRIGLNGKTISDSNNYKKMSDFCRRMELKFKLQKVLNPKRFLPKEMRQIPRQDSRKQKLKSVITECLWKVKGYEEFERLMKLKGYEIHKARGIAFIDKQKVSVKGSEVDYALSKIEKILAQKLPKLELIEKRIPRQESRKKESLLLRKKPSNNLLPKNLQKGKFGGFTHGQN